MKTHKFFPSFCNHFFATMIPSFTAAITATVATLIFSPQVVDADCFSKFELAPAYIHIDVLEANDTVKTLDMAAIRGEVNFVIGSGWSIKPCVTYGHCSDGEITIAGLGVGHCIPLGNCIILTPGCGVTYTDMHAKIKVDLGDMGKIKFHETFESWTPYLSLDAVFKIQTNLRLYLTAQYGWSQCKTNIGDFGTFHNDSEGPNWGAMIEYDVNECWSVNFGAGYNESFSRDKNGIRARGLKLGIAYWY